MFRTLLLGTIVLGFGSGVAFGADVATGKRSAPPVVQAAPAPSGRDNPAAPGGGATSTVGTVARVDGRIAFVTARDGREVRVALNDQTVIRTEAPGTPADVSAGVGVVIRPQGAPASDGSVTAAAVSIVPQGAAEQQGSFGERGRTAEDHVPGQLGPRAAGQAGH